MLVLKECNIADFHKNFYKPTTQKLAFHLPYVRILGTNHCGKMRKEAFKERQDRKDVITRCDYAERLTEKCLLKFNVNILVATGSYPWKVLQCRIST